MSVDFEYWCNLLAASPFSLDHAGCQWVFNTFGHMSQEDKIGQTLLPLARDLSPEAMAPMLRLKVGGIHRMPSRSREVLRTNAAELQSMSEIPLLLSADLEFSEKGSFSDGTWLTNQMGVAATGKDAAIEQMGEIAAVEGAWCGFNWTFTPVIDLDLNPRSSVVNTRSFGSSQESVSRAAELYIEAVQRNGMAACAKHWPGDGLDERDQHYVTSINDLSADEWRATFGKVYRRAITAGVKTMMAGHIALPVFQTSPGRAASLDSDLLRMLREELGFQGLIVSDATAMVGFLSQGKRTDLMPACLQAGCDMVLFPDRLEEDFRSIQNGLENGFLSPGRLDEAVLRILALKASLNLHASPTVRDFTEGTLQTHQSWAQGIAEDSITLVRDLPTLLPLTPEKYPRMLILQVADRHSPSGPLPPLQLANMFIKHGFEVTVHQAGDSINHDNYDVALYLVAEEGLSGKLGSLKPDWSGLHGAFPLTLYRLWHDIPALMVSFGSPYHLYDAPECGTLVNAYSAVPDVQFAAFQALIGQVPFRGQCPVDPFWGLLPSQRWS
ncbi:glycoside hydrolase family 3 protein [Sphingobium sp. YR768]|uniref:glycoside hydrolase family 3 protein n=1 Tax=Sphingobium sp. YR768 TaxID=1884365 RepID=UPI0008CBD9D6|nr:glycoside hydrolase family 3 N-terminal domain-containing protein [Sphingobium sp. YR768]SES18893.1 beta-N-acetylhexosaminidase [Sphingobium sp. YR768]